MNEYFKKNKLLVISGIIALSSLIATGFYYFYYRRNITLSKWLEKYAVFIEDLLKKEKNKLNIETVAYIINFMSELEDFLFRQDYSELESERIQHLDNPEVYEEFVYKTREGQDKIFHEACKYTEIRFNYSMIDLKEVIDKSLRNKKNKWRVIHSRNKFPYFKEDLPVIDTKTLREAYIEYVKSVNSNADLISREVIHMENNPDYFEEGNRMIYLIKYRSKDLLKSKNKFEDKYFDSMIANDKVLSKDLDILELKRTIDQVSSIEENENENEEESKSKESDNKANTDK